MALDKTGKPLPKGITWRENKQIYMIRFSFQGVSYTYYEKTLKDAKKTLSDRRYEVEHGQRGKADKVFVDSWYETWLTTYKIPNIKETSVRTYKQWYICYIQPTLGRRYLTQVNAVHFLDDLKASGEKITPKSWQAEVGRLTEQKDFDYQKMRAMRDDLKAVESLRRTAEQLAREGTNQQTEHDR